jgi:hypothetical protein
MVWKSVAHVFQGGTEAARALRGRHVRTVSILETATVDIGKPGDIGEKIIIAAGREGIVGFVPDNARDKITIAFPKAGGRAQSLDILMRAPFISVRINWPTFQSQFQIDI